MAELKRGGQVRRIDGKILTLNFIESDPEYNKEDDSISMEIFAKDPSKSGIPDRSLTFLSIEEAEQLIEELKEAIKGAKRKIKSNQIKTNQHEL